MLKSVISSVLLTWAIPLVNAPGRIVLQVLGTCMVFAAVFLLYSEVRKLNARVARECCLGGCCGTVTITQGAAPGPGTTVRSQECCRCGDFDQPCRCGHKQ